MGHLVKYLTVTSVAAALALPAVAASGPSSAAGSPQRGAHAAAATLATSPDRGRFFPRRLPMPLWVERTGGFAGFHHRINIRSDGAWTFRDLHRGSVVQGHLNRWQIRALSRLLGDPDLAGELGRPPRPSRCADAFEYQLTVLWHGWQRRASYTDCLDPGGPVVAVVRAVIDFTAL